MSVLLDTHAAIWYLKKPSLLSPRALRTIQQTLARRQPVYISAMSLIEAIFLAEKGRLTFEALQRLEAGTKDPASGIEIVPIDMAVADALYSIPRTALPDLPDRIIAATAVHLRIPLVTRDERIQALSIQTVW